MTNPIAIRRAKKIAEDSAGRSLSFDRVWIEKHLSEYQVRYSLPRTSGIFICNLRLDLSYEDFEAYEAWAAARS